MSTTQPAIFIPHGGGPWPFVDLGLPRNEVEAMSAYLRSLPALAPEPPKAVLVISAHWEARQPTVMTAPQPPLLFDYYGFPAESYRITWPAPGAPNLAARVRELLAAAGVPSAQDTERGFDHGTFVPLKLAWPNAEVPTLQLSLVQGLRPDTHLAIGRALAPLRDEGVMIIGSGMSFHNLRMIGDPRAAAASQTFDGWLRRVCTGEPVERDRALAEWEQAPAARAAHPREEHLLPLMVVAGSAGTNRGAVGFAGTMLGWTLSGIHFG